MNLSETATVSSYLDAHLVDHRERLPADPAPGNYVVIDVLYFSTTVAELFARGATRVRVTTERGDEPAYRDRNPDAVIGGSRADGFEPEAGYDFFNSPGYVHEVDVAGRPVALTSTNGGRAVTDLRQRGGDDVTVYVASTTNAGAVADHLRGDDAPTYLVSAGSTDGEATEDHLGAVLVARHLLGEPPAPVERELYADLLEVAKGTDYLDRKPEGRRADVTEFAAAFDSRGVVPRLDGRDLVDAARNRPAAATAEATT